jgi:hypothetical protein
VPAAQADRRSLGAFMGGKGHSSDAEHVVETPFEEAA